MQSKYSEYKFILSKEYFVSILNEVANVLHKGLFLCHSVLELHVFRCERNDQGLHYLLIESLWSNFLRKFSAKRSSRRYVTQYHVTLDSHCVLQRAIKVEGEVLSL